MAYHKTEHYDKETTEGLAANYTSIIQLLGEDPQREGLLKTPERMAKAMQFMTQGYGQDAVEILNSARFEESVR
jgi:GTP cyclohydrolase I